jgi:hypothetical protein
MSQPRESSIANRRPGVRGHRPFPLDPLATGRRTGTKVALASRNSDGVENFAEILGQLDNRQIKPQNVPRKKSAVHIPLFDMSEDEYQMENNSSKHICLWSPYPCSLAFIRSSTSSQRVQEHAVSTSQYTSGLFGTEAAVV